MLKRNILGWLKRTYNDYDDNIDFGRMSCEQIAQELLETFELNYCKVLEDNENGAEVLL